MSTPLYKRFKNGSSFYTFPSSSMHPNPNFTKFVLLNIPSVIDDTDSPSGIGRLDFEEENFKNNTYGIYADHASSSNLYSERLVESLRNYVANHDETMRNSRISTTKDFYNIKEKQTPTEIIFWKWLRKNNAIEFEVAKHKVDWDKNLTDFANPNADTLTNTDYFRKYLWKEREVINYAVETITVIGAYNGYDDVVSVIISYGATFKIGDKVLFSANLDAIKTGTEYYIVDVVYNNDSTQTTIYIKVVIDDINTFTKNIYSNDLPNIKLSYNRLVQYIGEINLKSDVRTARKDETEIMAYIPHQAGRTPSVLFSTNFNSNYYPNLKLPILPSQIQTEILGSENLDSPIRINPMDYPGLYYGQFDTVDKTYESSNGDKFRYSGDYFGIIRNDNIRLSDETYYEKPVEFNANNLDGINIDFNLNHYYKMSLTDVQVGFNFDEFNQIVIDGVQPQNFEYNAILWYYDVPYDTVGDTKTYTNLYGITFLNNPDNNINDNTTIETYKKLVSSNDYDGLSYIHTLNIMTSVDNDIKSMSFDPLTINNNYAFEIYQNVMTNVAKLNESYLNIMNSFLTMNTELNNVKGLVYTQTDIDTLTSKMKNMEDLLKLYSKYQFIDSDTVSITTNYAGIYPTLAFNVKNTEYSSVYNIKTSDIFNYRISNGSGYKINVPDSNKIFIKITNDDTTKYGATSIIFDKDLKYKQSAEIFINANNAYNTEKLDIKIAYNDGVVGYPVNTVLTSTYLPTDIGNYLTDKPTYSKIFYNNTSISQIINLVDSNGDTLVPYTLLYTANQNCFGSYDYNESVFIDNFIFSDINETIIDYSGVYKIGITENDFNQVYFKISLDTLNLKCVSIPVVYLVKNIKINITRVNDSETSTLNDRYLIQKTYE